MTDEKQRDDGGPYWCTQDCVWMGSELKRLQDRVVFLEKALEQQVKTCDELRKENTALLVRLENAEKL